MASAASSPDASAEHELDNMADRKPSLPVEEDIMQLARLGEIGAIQKLFDGGKFDATYKDDQGITPLHVRTSIGVRHDGEANLAVVGGYQQPLCPLPLSHTSWRAD
jgi:hypothetical protein